MPPNVERRLVILAEGNFGYHHGKTAMGVIRFGQDKVLAVIDSTQAGRNVREWLGDSGRFDIPIVASLSDALGFLPKANGLLIGIAPTGGKLPDDWRAVILAAIRSGLDIHSGLHTLLADDPEFAEAARSAGVRLVDYRRPPERMETSVGRLHEPGKRVILTVGTDCAIGKMSVALELRRAAAAQRTVRLVRRHGPDGDDDRGLGRRRGPPHRGLRPGHLRVAVRGGRAARRLGPGRGPGLAGPPGLQLGHAGPHPRLHAAGDGPGPHARHGRPRLRPPAGPQVPDRAAARLHPHPRGRSPAWWRRRRWWPWRSTRRGSPTRPTPGG